MNAPDSLMNLPGPAKALAAAALVAGIAVALATAVVALPRLDGHWNALAIASATGLAFVAVALIRLVLLAADRLLDRAEPIKPGDGKEKDTP